MSQQFLLSLKNDVSLIEFETTGQLPKNYECLYATFPKDS